MMISYSPAGNSANSETTVFHMHAGCNVWAALSHNAWYKGTLQHEIYFKMQSL